MWGLKPPPIRESLGEQSTHYGPHKVTMGNVGVRLGWIVRYWIWFKKGCGCKALIFKSGPGGSRFMINAGLY